MWWMVVKRVWKSEERVETWISVGLKAETS